MDAWLVYQLAVVDSMGITVTGIFEICRSLGIKDPAEVLLKIRSIMQGISDKAPRE